MIIKSLALPGVEVSTPHGPAWVLAHRMNESENHGTYALRTWCDIGDGCYQSYTGVAPGAHPAFLDTETTGLAGGAGTLAFLIGLGLWEDDGLSVELVFLRTPEEEPAALAYVEQRLAPATALVTFNGLGFDVPILESRGLLNRISASWRRLPHLDLLPVARTLWREALPSRRLSILEETFLGVHRSVEDVPSWMIPQLYRDYLLWGNAALMQSVFYHNRMDVLSLVTLLGCIGERLSRPESTLSSAAEWVGLGRLRAQAGDTAGARAAWQRALEDDLPPDVAAFLWHELATQHKQRAEWEAACALWHTWAERDPWAVEPLIELAKYNEWQAHNLDEALALTRRALERARQRPGGAPLATLAELQKRLQRLDHKRKNALIHPKMT